MEESQKPSGGLIALMSLDTPERAKATLGWVAPYVVFCVVGMALMSWGIAALGFVDLALWQYALAIALSAVAVFVSLCLLRGLSLRHAADEEPPPSSDKRG